MWPLFNESKHMKGALRLKKVIHAGNKDELNKSKHISYTGSFQNKE